MRPADPRRLLLKPVGTERPLDRAKLVSFFRGILMSRVESYIARMMRTGEISIFEIEERMGSFRRSCADGTRTLSARAALGGCGAGLPLAREVRERGALFRPPEAEGGPFESGADGAEERCSRGIVTGGETPLRRDGSSAGSGAVCGRSLRAGRKTRRL